MSNSPILAGVIGWPISHSLSPLIHTAWAARAGVNGYYIPVAIEPDYESFASAMASLKTVGFAGVNVTIPHKENALRYALEQGAGASELAQKAGAANVMTFRDEGPYADNSDVIGFEQALKAKLKPGEDKGAAFVIGAGGASRGVVLALQNLGFNDIAITNRTTKKAAAAAAEFGLNVVGWDQKESALSGAGVVVNTTSLGMTGQPPLEIDLTELNRSAIVCDIVYSPLETPLLKAALAKGHSIVDGLDMLMHQAAPCFATWFGAKPSVDKALRAELIAELERKAQP